MSNAYYKQTLTGGTSNALDNIDGDILSNNDVALILYNDVGYFYKLDTSSGAVESSPNIISPDINAGTKRWILQNMKSSGSGLPQLTPDNMSLDDTDTEVTRGSIFSMTETIDYGSTSADGSAWITFNFPSSLDADTDIDLDIYYHLSGSDNSKVVVFKTAYWCKAIGEAPNPASADGTNTDNISTGTGEDGEIRKETLTAIPNADIAAGDTIFLKLTREGSNGTDTYTGTFQLLYIMPSQS